MSSSHNGDPLKLVRHFQPADRPCPYKCQYCFAKLDDYEPRFASSADSGKKPLLLYPSCDGEFLMGRDAIMRLERLRAGITSYTIITFSTKGLVSDEVMRAISNVNHDLLKNDIGFIKFTVSLTNKYRVTELEPLTSKYKDRIDVLRRADDLDIPTSVTIKPILPFISSTEYLEIIDDTMPFVGAYLLGDLYISENSPFYEQYIKGKYDFIKRPVAWLAYEPGWVVIECALTKNRLREEITSRGGVVFDSDIDVAYSLRERARVSLAEA